jgi:hypothetical protein
MVRVTTGYYRSLSNFVTYDRVFWHTPSWGMRTYLGIACCLSVASAVAAILLHRSNRPDLDPERLRGGGPDGRPGARGMAVCAALGVLLALLLATRPVGYVVVKFVPLAGYVQFPWRMFLFSSCLAALCAPAAVDGFFRGARARLAAAAITIACVIGFQLPGYGPQAPLVRSHLQVEKFLRGLSIDYVTSMNEYLPLTVKRAVPTFDLVAHVVDGTAQLALTSRAPGRYRADVVAESPAIVEFNAHWFPGWRARVDGDEVTIGPDGAAPIDSGGLIRVRVPPGRHTVTLGFGRTPLRLACDNLSLAALIGALTLLGLGWRRRRVLPSPRA